MKAEQIRHKVSIYPTFSRIYLVNSPKDLENQLINGYQSVPNEEFEAEVESEPLPAALIPHAVALDALKMLNLYKLQRGTTDTILQQQYYRERRRIEVAHIAERSQQRQRTIEEFIGTLAGRDS